jgi:hypothetical protein
MLAFVLHVRSPEIPTAPNNTAKIILEKGGSQIWGDSKTSLPQGLGDCKPFDWNDVNGFSDRYERWESSDKVDQSLSTQEVSSGYLKNSVTPKT